MVEAPFTDSLPMPSIKDGGKLEKTVVLEEDGGGGGGLRREIEKMIKLANFV